ncbi:hypothetical protein C1H46_025141 [Malus baccata]|uniref:Pentatricopeptide repeat-containing protein n=1 Tax=Malus baccata TaxID=106549 RepID=A0A540LSQ2_MALBA|nr:hypothetical protein C1H46_025141 [Malus baccata]
MLRWYFMQNLYEEVIGFYNRMRMCAREHDNSVFLIVLKACSELRDLDKGRKVHCRIVKVASRDSFVLTGLVDVYVKCGWIECSWAVFDGIVVVRNVSGNLNLGRSIHGLGIKLGLEESTVRNALVDMYAKCRMISDSCYIFERISDKNVIAWNFIISGYSQNGSLSSQLALPLVSFQLKNTITWSAMISGYGIQGDSTGSLALFSDMLEKHLEPNEVIFTTLLSACSHTGVIAEGWSYFNSLCKDYNFKPSMKHYACMVDLLARAGKLEEALEFIERMPIQPDVSLFGAFLHGCGLYSRFDLGEVAIRRMLELHPGEACYYVLMRNLARHFLRLQYCFTGCIVHGHASSNKLMKKHHSMGCCTAILDDLTAFDKQIIRDGLLMQDLEGTTQKKGMRVE